MSNNMTSENIVWINAWTKGPPSKHIAIKYYYIRGCVKNGEIELNFYELEDQVEDTLMKLLKVDSFKKLWTIFCVGDFQIQF